MYAKKVCYLYNCPVTYELYFWGVEMCFKREALAQMCMINSYEDTIIFKLHMY